MQDDIAVVGGMHVDIGAKPEGRLIPGDSNPGRVTLRPGGVGRNIAHNLRLLGLDVRLVSAGAIATECVEANNPALAGLV